MRIGSPNLALIPTTSLILRQSEHPEGYLLSSERERGVLRNFEMSIYFGVRKAGSLVQFSWQIVKKIAKKDDKTCWY